MGFTFDGHEFYLTMENQTNFANMFIAREYFLEYPQKRKLKLKLVLWNYQDADEVSILSCRCLLYKAMYRSWLGRKNRG